MGQGLSAELVHNAKETGEMSLADMQLEDVNKDIRKLNNYLVSLDIKNNVLDHFPRPLKRLTKLKKLDISFNRLHDLQPEINRLTNLQHLIASNNEITKMTDDVCKRITSLTMLELGHNKLTDLPMNLSKNRGLHTLHLDSNEFTRIPHVVYSLLSLTDLNLSTNQLSTLSGDLNDLEQLQILNLAFNQITFVPAPLMDMQSLRVLRLNDNQLPTLPNSINQLVQLEELDVSNNQLEQLPVSLCACTNLTTLRLSNNRITALHEEFGHLLQLLVLELSNNNIASVPPTLAALTSLQTLNLAANDLKSLPDELGKLTQLETLELGSNPLPMELRFKNTEEVLDVLNHKEGTSSGNPTLTFRIRKLTSKKEATVPKKFPTINLNSKTWRNRDSREDDDNEEEEEEQGGGAGGGQKEQQQQQQQQQVERVRAQSMKERPVEEQSRDSTATSSTIPNSASQSSFETAFGNTSWATMTPAQFVPKHTGGGGASASADADRKAKYRQSIPFTPVPHSPQASPQKLQPAAPRSPTSQHSHSSSTSMNQSDPMAIMRNITTAIERLQKSATGSTPLKREDFDSKLADLLQFCSTAMMRFGELETAEMNYVHMAAQVWLSIKLLLTINKLKHTTPLDVPLLCFLSLYLAKLHVPSLIHSGFVMMAIRYNIAGRNNGVAHSLITYALGKSRDGTLRTNLEKMLHNLPDTSLNNSISTYTCSSCKSAIDGVDVVCSICREPLRMDYQTLNIISTQSYISCSYCEATYSPLTVVDYGRQPCSLCKRRHTLSHTTIIDRSHLRRLAGLRQSGSVADLTSDTNFTGTGTGTGSEISSPRSLTQQSLSSAGTTTSQLQPAADTGTGTGTATTTATTTTTTATTATTAATSTMAAPPLSENAETIKPRSKSAHLPSVNSVFGSKSELADEEFDEKLRFREHIAEEYVEQKEFADALHVYQKVLSEVLARCESLQHSQNDADAKRLKYYRSRLSTIYNYMGQTSIRMGNQEDGLAFLGKSVEILGLSQMSFSPRKEAPSKSERVVVGEPSPAPAAAVSPRSVDQSTAMGNETILVHVDPSSAGTTTVTVSSTGTVASKSEQEVNAVPSEPVPTVTTATTALSTTPTQTTDAETATDSMETAATTVGTVGTTTTAATTAAATTTPTTTATATGTTAPSTTTTQTDAESTTDSTQTADSVAAGTAVPVAVESSQPVTLAPVTTTTAATTITTAATATATTTEPAPLSSTTTTTTAATTTTTSSSSSSSTSAPIVMSLNTTSSVRVTHHPSSPEPSSQLALAPATTAAASTVATAPTSTIAPVTPSKLLITPQKSNYDALEWESEFTSAKKLNLSPPASNSRTDSQSSSTTTSTTINTTTTTTTATATAASSTISPSSSSSTATASASAAATSVVLSTSTSSHSSRPAKPYRTMDQVVALILHHDFEGAATLCDQALDSFAESTDEKHAPPIAQAVLVKLAIKIVQTLQTLSRTPEKQPYRAFLYRVLADLPLPLQLRTTYVQECVRYNSGLNNFRTVHYVASKALQMLDQSDAKLMSELQTAAEQSQVKMNEEEEEKNSSSNASRSSIEEGELPMDRNMLVYKCPACGQRTSAGLAQCGYCQEPLHLEYVHVIPLSEPTYLQCSLCSSKFRSDSTIQPDSQCSICKRGVVYPRTVAPQPVLLRRSSTHPDVSVHEDVTDDTSSVDSHSSLDSAISTSSSISFSTQHLSPESNRSPQELSQRGLTYLDKGNIRKSSQCFDQAVALYIHSPSLQTVRPDVIKCVRYKLALRLLGPVQSIQSSSSEVERKQATIYSVLLASVELFQRHREVCLNMAMRLNYQMQNWGILKEMVEWKLTHFKASEGEKQKLEQQIRTCEQNRSQNHALPAQLHFPTYFCGSSLQPILLQVEEPITVCPFCDTIYRAAIRKATDGCELCTYRKLSSFRSLQSCLDQLQKR